MLFFELIDRSNFWYFIIFDVDSLEILVFDMNFDLIGSSKFWYFTIFELTCSSKFSLLIPGMIIE